MRELLFLMTRRRAAHFQDLVFSNLRIHAEARAVARRPMNDVDVDNHSTPHDRQPWIKLANVTSTDDCRACLLLR